MGKHEAGTPKALAKAMKARGLKKLRFYCQVCEKQCLDENGFKCHKQSEAHLRKMQIFAASAGKYLDQYSEQFEKNFLDLLSRRYNTKRVNANTVYNEYIQDRHHVHMTATIWTSLSQFVQHLGQTSKCKVDETEKGWYVQWIDRSSTTQSDIEKKRKLEQDDETRRQRLLERQMKAASEAPVQATPQDPDLAKCTTIGLVPSKKKRRTTGVVFEDEEEEVLEKDVNEEQKTRFSVYPDTWLCEGLVVKIVSRKAGDGLKGQKAHVVEVEASGRAKVELLKDPSRVLSVKESHLETVLPDIGRPVAIVSPQQVFQDRGELATLESIDVDKYRAIVEIQSGPGAGQKRALDYENVCKVKS